MRLKSKPEYFLADIPNVDIHTLNQIVTSDADHSSVRQAALEEIKQRRTSMTVHETKNLKLELTKEISRMIEIFEQRSATTVANIHVRTAAYCQTFPDEARVIITVEVPNLEQI